jgi:dTDP-4-amino-4,6-dideoxygalactose transaminase
MKVNFVDLVAQYHSQKEEIDNAVIKILERGNYILGENVKALENEIAEFCGVRYGIGVNSGTDALLLSLMALDIKPQDEVIIPAFTIFVDAEVVALLKAKPVFVDIDPRSFNIDPLAIEEKITDRTKAIIVVHLFGQSTDMDAVLKIARKYKLKVIEDACQAIGAEYKGKRVGGIGDVGCFSFYPTKNLGAFGDSGMIVTDDQKIAIKLKLMRQHGSVEQFKQVMIGLNSKLDEIHAAILRIKLRKLNEWNEKRRELAHLYNKNLKDTTDIITPWVDEKCKHVYHQYTVRATRREELQNYLLRNNISTKVFYPQPIHLQEIYKYLGYHEGQFPLSENAAKEVLSLPVYAEMNKKQIEYIIQKLKEFYANLKIVEYKK